MNEPNVPNSLPPIPANLWPKVCPVAARVKPGGRIVLELAAFPENLLLPVLCRAVHHEMRWAGQWAAGIGLASKREFPSEEALSRHSAENAARLLAMYSALHTAYAYQGPLNPSPDDLKAAASRTYQIQLRESLHHKQQHCEASQPSTFQSEQPKSDLTPTPTPPSTMNLHPTFQNIPIRRTLRRSITAVRIATTALSLAFSALAAHATLVNIPNASFENPTTPTGGDGVPIPGWVFNSQSGNLYGTSLINNAFTSKGAASGNIYAWMQNDGSGKTDTITTAASLGTIEADTTYTLSVAIGNVAGSDSVSNHSPGNVSFSLLANGVAFATREVPSGTVPDGTFEDFSLTFMVPSSDSIIGESLGIQLASLPTSSLGYGPAFDNVTLDADTIAAAPEPPTCALLLSGVLTLGWLARRKLVRT